MLLLVSSVGMALELVAKKAPKLNPKLNGNGLHPKAPRAIAQGMVVAMIGLAACSPPPQLNMNLIEASILSDIQRQEGITVQDLTCPETVAIAVEDEFFCTGTLEPEGESFFVRVEQQDEQGNVFWEVPNSGGLLNLTQLEDHFQTTIQDEIGLETTVDCGGIYRLNQPGESFECRVLNAEIVEQRRLEVIQITLDRNGDVNWQQIHRWIADGETVVDPNDPNASADSDPSSTSEHPEPVDPEHPFSEEPITDSKI